MDKNNIIQNFNIFNELSENTIGYITNIGGYALLKDKVMQHEMSKQCEKISFVFSYLTSNYLNKPIFLDDGDFTEYRVYGYFEINNKIYLVFDECVVNHDCTYLLMNVDEKNNDENSVIDYLKNVFQLEEWQELCERYAGLLKSIKYEDILINL